MRYASDQGRVCVAEEVPFLPTGERSHRYVLQIRYRCAVQIKTEVGGLSFRIKRIDDEIEPCHLPRQKVEVNRLLDGRSVWPLLRRCCRQGPNAANRECLRAGPLVVNFGSHQRVRIRWIDTDWSGNKPEHFVLRLGL